MERAYLALVWGVPDAGSGVIDAPIGRSVRRPTRMAVREGGRAARTRYSVERTYTDPQVSLLGCALETGRTHQIRVPLAAIKHPVVGDPAYGGIRAGIDIARPFLHAATLAFAHPVTGEPQRFTSELPPDLGRVLDQLDLTGYRAISSGCSATRVADPRLATRDRRGGWPSGILPISSRLHPHLCRMQWPLAVVVLPEQGQRAVHREGISATVISAGEAAGRSRRRPRAWSGRARPL